MCRLFLLCQSLLSCIASYKNRYAENDIYQTIVSHSKSVVLSFSIYYAVSTRCSIVLLLSVVLLFVDFICTSSEMCKRTQQSDNKSCHRDLASDVHSVASKAAAFLLCLYSLVTQMTGNVI
jgi:hypothetical protein